MLHCIFCSFSISHATRLLSSRQEMRVPLSWLKVLVYGFVCYGGEVGDEGDFLLESQSLCARKHLRDFLYQLLILQIGKLKLK